MTSQTRRQGDNKIKCLVKAHFSTKNNSWVKYKDGMNNAYMYTVTKYFEFLLNLFYYLLTLSPYQDSLHLVSASTHTGRGHLHSAQQGAWGEYFFFYVLPSSSKIIEFSGAAFATLPLHSVGEAGLPRFLCSSKL